MAPFVFLDRPFFRVKMQAGDAKNGTIWMVLTLHVHNGIPGFAQNDV